MKIFLVRLATVVKRAWVWSLLLLLICALLIWCIGPRLAFDDFRPWADTSPRLLTLCILALVWGLFVIVSGWQKGRQGRAPKSDGEQAAPSLEPTRHAHEGLRLHFKQARQTLSSARLYRGRSERWRNGLPWYLLLGPQGSGKTSLLEYSGLNLPLNPRQDKAIAPPAPTSDCDWYFAEQGVLLDTHGDYLTQFDDGSMSGWNMLLKLLARHRRSKPLNGVLINIPVNLLLTEDKTLLEQLADQVRSRLEDIHRHLHSQSPVYLVLSKADRIPGFDCFHNHLGREQSQQPFGVHFSETERADAKLLTLKFDELLSHLGSQVIERSRGENHPKRVARIADFPRRMSLIVTPLTTFVDKAFAGNHFQPGNPLRGVYLTSAPHLESADETAPASTGKRHSRGARGKRKMRGQPRFIHDVLSQIIFPEAGMARLDQKEVRRVRWQQLAMCSAAVGCLGLFGSMWAKGFSQNSERLTHLNQLGEQLAQDRLKLNVQDDAFATLPLLEKSHGALRLFTAPEPATFGHLTTLDQHRTVHPALLNAYRHELQTRLLPRITRQLENRVRADLNNREPLLNSFRAYLMLNDLEHRDVAFMNNSITAEWRAGYAATTDDQQKLSRHLSRLFEHPVRVSLDTELIKQARQALRNTPMADLTYQTLKDKARLLPDYHLNRQVDPHGALFVDSGGSIPGFYTKKSYQRYFLAQGMSLVQEGLRDGWVMGEGNLHNISDLQALMIEIEQLYLRDYADHWSQAIGEIEWSPINSVTQGAQQAALLTAASSPLLKLLIEIRENTRFEAPQTVAEEQVETGMLPQPTLAKAAASVADQTKSALQVSLPNGGRIALQRRFESLHRLLDEAGNPALELTSTSQALNNLQLQLATVARSSQPGHAAFDLAKSRMGGQLDAISVMRTSSARLPPPLNGWLGTLADDSWRVLLDDTYRYINQRYQRELYSVYDQAIAKRYPFMATSESDVTIADFREFFKVQGLAERFFDHYLKPFIKDDSQQYRLRGVDDRSLPVSLSTLNQMARVQTIRRSFFREDPEQPQVKFRLEPYSLDQNLSRADFRFGDKQLEYRHGPIVPLALQWPADADNGIASLIVEESGGRRVGYQENTGPWSLFRLIERMETQPHSGRGVLMLKANLEERRVNYLLMSQRSPNPFELGDLRAFRLPAVL